MKQDIKERWVASLETGQLPDGRPVQQAKNVLKADDSNFCCLGVLCELAVMDGVIPSPDLSQDHYWYGQEGAESYQSLPPAVSEWAEVDSNPCLDIVYDNTEDLIKDEDFNGTLNIPLAELNDDWDKDFPTIATLIKEQL